MLRRNPPEVRVTSGQKSSTKIIYIVLQTSVGLLKISCQKYSFLDTDVFSRYTKRRKRMITFCTSSLNFESYFPRSYEKLFSVLFQIQL